MDEPLTVLQQKLAEAHGLAIAAGDLTHELEPRLPGTTFTRTLRELRRDAEETRVRCLGAEAGFGAEAAEAMLAHANTIQGRAADLAHVWLRAGTDPLAAWTALAELAAGTGDVADLAAWALPVQRRHLDLALAGAAELARLEDATAPRFG